MVLRVIIVMLLLFPITAFSQSSLYRSTPEKSALGMSLSFLDNGKILNGYLVSPIDTSTQAIFGAGIRLLDNQNLTPSLSGVSETTPPSPSGVIALEKTRALGTTGLQSFLSGGFMASSEKKVSSEDNLTLRSIVDLTALGGAGIFKCLQSSSELVITPSFGVYYAYTWQTTDYKLSGEKFAAEFSDFSGTAGLQLDLAPEVSVWSTLTFSFDNPETVLRVGFNWY